MNCPICGRELPKNARKCGNCGCRPKYLYGRAPMPKWVKGVVAAVLSAAILTVLMVTIMPKLPGNAPTQPSAPTEPSVPAEPMRYELSVRTEYNYQRLLSTVDYTYDKDGNLTQVRPFSSVSSVFPVKTQFLYDSDGVFVGLRQVRDFTEEVRTLGTVTYEEDQVLIRLTNADGSNPQTVVFRYDSNGRIKGFAYGEWIYVLEHNNDGKLLNLHILYGDMQTDVYIPPVTYTWTYRKDGSVSWVQSDNGKDYVCVTDEKGNVTDFYDLADPESSLCTSAFKTVTASQLTAQQYELQQYLLFALNITPVGTLHPVVKNAMD